MKKKLKIKKKENRKALFAFISIIVILYIMISLSSDKDDFDRKICPFNVEGNNNSDFVIKYVDSPYCFWCMIEKPILKKMVKTKGHLFKLEHYDIRYRSDIVKKHKFSGTPSFVFSVDNGAKEYARMGYINEENLEKIICELSKGC